MSTQLSLEMHGDRPMIDAVGYTVHLHVLKCYTHGHGTQERALPALELSCATQFPPVKACRHW
eukprot:324182-Amphidinium_carterae.2